MNDSDVKLHEFCWERNSRPAQMMLLGVDSLLSFSCHSRNVKSFYPCLWRHLRCKSLLFTCSNPLYECLNLLLRNMKKTPSPLITTQVTPTESKAAMFCCLHDASVKAYLVQNSILCSNFAVKSTLLQLLPLRSLSDVTKAAARAQCPVLKIAVLA